jgi:hypothetical protein
MTPAKAVELVGDTLPATETPANGRRLDSWKEIAVYLNREVRTAMRWEKERGLPVHRIPGKRSGVYAVASEVDAWLRAEANGNSGGDSMPVALPQPVSAKGEKPARWLVISGALALLGIAILLLRISAPGPLVPQLLHPVPVTNDGLLKNDLLPSGRAVYIWSGDGERSKLERRSASGGMPSPVSFFTPGNRWPLDISPDESAILVLQRDSSDCPCPLWSVPASGGAGRRLGDVAARSAAWSPDGKMLAYATGRDLYVANRDGGMPRRLATVSGFPEALRWSPDGKRLRMVTMDRNLVAFPTVFGK